MRFRLRSALFLSALFTAICGAQTPVLVHAVGGENSRGAQANPADYYIPDAEVTIAGNCLGLFAIWQTADVASVSVSDDKSDTFSLIKEVVGTANAAAVWIAPNVAAGAHYIDLHLSGSYGSINDVMGQTFELANCPATSPVDVSSGQESSGTSISAGSLTPSASGEYLMQFVGLEQTSPTAVVPTTSSFTVGSQPNITWALQLAELLDGNGMQSGVYNSTAAINPTMTSGTSVGYISIAIAVKTGSNSGGLPSGPYVIREEHVSMWSTEGGGPGYSNPSVEQFPCSGNTLMVMANGGSPITSISENGTNLSYWNFGNANYPATYIGAGASESEQAFYATAHTCNNSHTFSITPDLTYTGSGYDYDYTVVFYDIAKGGSIDTAVAASGNISSCSSPCNLAGPTYTPSASGEMIFNMISQWYNVVDGVSSPGVSDTVYGMLSGTPAYSPPPLDQNNGWAHYLNSGNSSFTNTWTYYDTTTAQGYYGAVAVGLKFFSPGYNGKDYVNGGANGRNFTLASPQTGRSYPTSAFVNPQVPAPTASPAAGTYTSAQNVTLSDTLSGAYICYTLNGSTPTGTSSSCTNGTHYTGAISNVGTTGGETLNAIANYPAYTQSAEFSGTYTVSVNAVSASFAYVPGSVTGCELWTYPNSTTCPYALHINPTSGHLLVITTAWYYTSGSPTIAFSCKNNGSATPIGSTGVGTGALAGWYWRDWYIKETYSGADTCTMSSTAGVWMAWESAEFSYSGTISGLDGTPQTAQVTANSSGVGTVSGLTTSGSSDLVLVGSILTSEGGETVGPGYTMISDGDTCYYDSALSLCEGYGDFLSSNGGTIEYAVGVAAGAQSATYTGLTAGTDVINMDLEAF